MDQNRRDMRRAAAEAFLESLNKLEETLQEDSLKKEDKRVPDSVASHETPGPEPTSRATVVDGQNQNGQNQATTPQVMPPEQPTANIPNNTPRAEEAKPPRLAAPTPIEKASTPNSPRVPAPSPPPVIPENLKSTSPPVAQRSPQKSAMSISLSELEQAIADIDQFMQSRTSPKQTSLDGD